MNAPMRTSDSPTTRNGVTDRGPVRASTPTPTRCSMMPPTCTPIVVVVVVVVGEVAVVGAIVTGAVVDGAVVGATVVGGIDLVVVVVVLFAGHGLGAVTVVSRNSPAEPYSPFGP